MISIRDVTIKDDRPTDLLLQKHEKYLKHYASEDAGTEQIMAEYIKMSGMYWGLNALYLMTTLEDNSPDVSRALDFIRQCQNKDGGFAAAQRHDSHILHTLSAVQILVILNKCNSHYIDIDKCVGYVASLQQKDGSFFGDKWGEVDTRFSFCALAALKLLKRLDAINMDDAVKFVMSCNNQIDGGFGSKPGSESHSAYVYCCIGCLSIAGQLHRVDADQLGQWLSERQLPSGGLNGRPEKLPDVCYSWWCLSSMKMINRMHLIDHEKLLKFILACQDEEQGGFSDRPGNWVDPFHTVFGLASMSLICYHFDDLDHLSDKKADGDTESSARKNFFSVLRKLKISLKRVDPTLCMPEEILVRHQISR